MDENKCCESYASSYAKDMDSFCVREFLHKFKGCNEDSDHHSQIINGWTKITSSKISEIEAIDSNRVVVAWLDNLNRMQSVMLVDCRMAITTMVKVGGYYYYVLPKLMKEE
jgi:hypothetical protein